MLKRQDLGLRSLVFGLWLDMSHMSYLSYGTHVTNMKHGTNTTRVQSPNLHFSIACPAPNSPATSRMHKPTGYSARQFRICRLVRLPHRRLLPTLLACPLRCPEASMFCGGQPSLRLRAAARLSLQFQFRVYARPRRPPS